MLPLSDALMQIVFLKELTDKISGGCTVFPAYFRAQIRPHLLQRCQSFPLSIKQKVYKTRHLSNFHLKVPLRALDKTIVRLSNG